MPEVPQDDGAVSLLSKGIALLIVLAALGLVYLSVTSGMPVEPYTEFYVLGPEGEASDYPTNLSVGDRGEVVVGVVNHEFESATYSIVLVLGGTEVDSTTRTLKPSEVWQGRFSFRVREPGTERLHIRLYRGPPRSTSEPYRSLWIDISVVERTETGNGTGPESTNRGRAPYL